MKRIATLIAAAGLVATASPLLASASVGFERPETSARELPPYLQCVPYARQLSGIHIYGDAHTWWGQAAGRYERGRTPKVGAVMAFQPHRNMQLGHVAAVSKVVDQRTVLLDHANWSPIDGRRGQIERDVMAVDVSPGNDWSEVRVWYAPQGGLGTSSWPVHGFIYSKRAKLDRGQIAAAPVARPTPVSVAPVSAPVRAEPSRAFASAFAGFGSAPAQGNAGQGGARQNLSAQAAPRRTAQRVAQHMAQPQAQPAAQQRRAPVPQALPASRPAGRPASSPANID
ncbi:MAG: hypothetical protein B7X57_10840, partial [Erythrobacter sp. 34-65-8]